MADLYTEVMLMDTNIFDFKDLCIGVHTIKYYFYLLEAGNSGIKTTLKVLRLVNLPLLEAKSTSKRCSGNHNIHLSGVACQESLTIEIESVKLKKTKHRELVLAGWRGSNQLRPFNLMRIMPP